MATAGAFAGARSPKALGLGLENSGDRGCGVAAGKRVHAGHELVQNHAEREQICSRVNRRGANLFRRHVGGRAEHAVVAAERDAGR